MDYLPVFLDLRGRTALVVGGGSVAGRKAALLLKAGATVRVVAPEIDESLGAMPGLACLARNFEPADLDGAALVIAATDDRAVNGTVAALAQARHLPVNVVDDPELCSFVMPAIVDRGRVVVAISAGGASPVLSRLIRARLELALPPILGTLADAAARLRGRVRAALPELGPRRRFWEAWLGRALADGEIPPLDALLAAASPGRLDIIEIAGAAADDVPLGAIRRIGAADLVLHHRTVPVELLDFARRDAELRAIPADADIASVARAEVDRGRSVAALVTRRQPDATDA